METSKDKAKELVDKYSKVEVTILGCGEGNPCVISDKMGQIAAKECAKIAVQEIIKALHEADTDYDLVKDIELWNEVLKEIDNL
jgi:L-ascorbate metabolism protein UlaG (beta-lactamase superfamily)